MKPSAILRAARQLIIERGHARGAFQGKTGCLCVEGAIHCAVTGDPYWQTKTEACMARASLASYLGYPDSLGPLQKWNDSTPTDTVLQTMERAAEALEKEGR